MQRQWDSTEKGALCRSFFPMIEQRLKMKIPIVSEFTVIVTGHGKTKLYLHRFRLADNQSCPCNEGAQLPEHIIYECQILEHQRCSLKQHITASGGYWPPANSDVVAKYLNAFSRFISSIDFKIALDSAPLLDCKHIQDSRISIFLMSV
jgi:hypothetical protein